MMQFRLDVCRPLFGHVGHSISIQGDGVSVSPGRLGGLGLWAALWSLRFRFGQQAGHPFRRPLGHQVDCFSPDSEAMGFLLQKTMSCPCALSRQVAGAGAVSLRVWRQVAGAGCWVPVLVLWAGCARGGDRLLAPELVLGAWCRCWSWLCTWWRQVAGAGAVSWLCRVAVPVLHVEAGAGAGAGCPCWCWVLGAGAVAGCARGGDRLLVLVL